jgi:hypothetical protein
MINRRSIAPLLIAMSVALAACEDRPTTIAHHYVEGAWSLAQGVMKDGPLLVVVEGNPFEAPAAQLESRIVQIMTDAVTWTATPRFTTDPALTTSDTLRIVITFNPLQRTGAHEQCTGQSRGDGPLPDGRVQIIGTFCDAATLLVTVSGRVGNAADLHNAQVTALVQQMTLDMLSPQQKSP